MKTEEIWKSAEETIEKEEKLRQEIAGDFEHSYFCEAGAGAGKTALIVRRITEQLRSGWCRPQEIAAITFTNKAAQELYGRILSALAEEKRKAPGEEKLLRAVREISRMQISTIHSFCNRLLKENCFEAGLKPDFELLEDAAAAEEKKKFFRSWFNEHSEEIRTLLKQDPETESISFSQLADNFCAVCDLPENTELKHAEIEELLKDHTGDLEKEITDLQEKTVKEYKNALEEELSKESAGGTSFYRHQYADTEVQKKLKKAFQDSTKDPEFLKKLKTEDGHCPFSRPRQTEKEALYGVCDAAYQRISGSCDEIEEKQEYNDKRKSALKAAVVIEIVAEAREEYRKNRSGSRLSNDQLLQRTAELLKNPAVCKKVRKKYRCIYVDEFQDTDPVQRELILNLCSENGRILPGKLFAVGDVKQSIYRFRNADYRLFHDTKRIFEGQKETCRVVSLKINNRSNQELLEFYREKSEGEALRELLGPVTMIPRQGKREGRMLLLHGVYQLGTEAQDKEKEAEQLVRLIRHLKEHARINVYDSQKKETVIREIRYSDFLILTANAEGNEKYAEVLLNSGIPAQISLKIKPGEIQALRRFAAVYRYLALPEDQRAKEGILEVAQADTGNKADLQKKTEKLRSLREQLKGLSGAGKAGWLLEHSELYLYSEKPVEGCVVRRCQMLLRQMVDQCLSGVDNNPLSLSQALMKYVDKTNQQERETACEKSGDFVRLMNIHKAKGLEGNIVIIAQRRDEKTDPTSWSAEKPDETGKIPRWQVVSFKNPHGKNSGCSTYALEPAIAKQAETERKKEAARLEYVAVTRAREALIFMPPQGAGEPMFSAYTAPEIRMLYKELPETPAGSSAGGPADETETASSGTEETGRPGRMEEKGLIRKDPEHAQQALKEQAEQKQFSISPYMMEISGSGIPARAGTAGTEKEDAGEPAGPASAPEEPENGETEGTVPEEEEMEMNPEEASAEEEADLSEAASGRPCGNVFGTVMHRAFELAVQGTAEGREDPELWICRAINENNEDIELKYGEAAETCRGQYRQYLRTILPDFVRKMQEELQGAEQILTEHPFSFYVSEGELEQLRNSLTLTEKLIKMLPVPGTENRAKVWVNGKADLIIVRKDRVTVWDYKSDLQKVLSPDRFSEMIHRKYDNQMKVYLFVAEKEFSRKAEGKFYSAECGELAGTVENKETLKSGD